MDVEQLLPCLGVQQQLRALPRAHAAPPFWLCSGVQGPGHSHSEVGLLPTKACLLSYGVGLLPTQACLLSSGAGLLPTYA